jgi:hypothetical protein
MQGLGYAARIFDNGRLVDFAGQEGINFFFIPKS